MQIAKQIMQKRQISPRCILNSKNGGRQQRNRIMTEQVNLQQQLERRTIFESSRQQTRQFQGYRQLQCRSQSQSKVLSNVRRIHEPSFRRLRDAITIRSLSRQSSQNNSINSGTDSLSLNGILRQATSNDEAKIGRMLAQFNENCQRQKDTSQSYFTMTRQRSHKSQLDHFQQNKFLRQQCSKIVKNMKQMKHRHKMSCRLKRERQSILEQIELIGGRQTTKYPLMDPEEAEPIKLHVHHQYFYGSYQQEPEPAWMSRATAQAFRKRQLGLIN